VPRRYIPNDPPHKFSLHPSARQENESDRERERERERGGDCSPSATLLSSHSFALYLPPSRPFLFRPFVSASRLTASASRRCAAENLRCRGSALLPGKEGPHRRPSPPASDQEEEALPVGVRALTSAFPDCGTIRPCIFDSRLAGRRTGERGEGEATWADGGIELNFRRTEGKSILSNGRRNLISALVHRSIKIPQPTTTTTTTTTMTTTMTMTGGPSFRVPGKVSILTPRRLRRHFRVARSQFLIY